MTTPTEPEVHHTHTHIKTYQTKPQITQINASPCQALGLAAWEMKPEEDEEALGADCQGHSAT